MAEAIARHIIQQGALGRDPDLFVASAGTSAATGGRPTSEALTSLRALGIEHRGTSKPLTGDMIRNAQIVFCMTAGHVRTADALAPDQPDGKILQLDPDGDIDDPIGLDEEAYDALAARLMKLIPGRLSETLDHESSTGIGSSGG